MVNAIKETLHSENLLPDSVIKSLKADCTPEQLNEIFASLSGHSRCLFEVARSLSVSTVEEKRSLAHVFIKAHFLPCVSKEENDETKRAFKELIEAFPAETTREVVALIGGECPKTFLNHLGCLSPNEKSIFLRGFLSRGSKLEKAQVPNLERLFFEGIPLDLLGGLVEVLCGSAGDLAADKQFGKLLVNLVETKDRNLALFERELKVVIRNHKSVWRARAESALEALFVDVSHLSQSLL